MSREDDYIRMQIQQHFDTPVGIRANEETLYANIAHEPLMLDNVRQIKVLQIYDALQANIKIRQEKPVTQDYIFLYVIDKRREFVRSSSGLLFYDGSYYTEEELQNNFGITSTPSVVYYVRNGVMKCWYNDNLKKYWDTETSKWLLYPPDYDENPIDEITDINQIGAMGMFLYYSKNNETTLKYGTVVDGSRLKSTYFRLPTTGFFTYTEVKDLVLTGLWKILTEIKIVSENEPCMVFAVKVSDNDIIIESEETTTKSKRQINNNNIINTENNNSSSITEETSIETNSSKNTDTDSVVNTNRNYSYTETVEYDI